MRCVYRVADRELSIVTADTVSNTTKPDGWDELVRRKAREPVNYKMLNDEIEIVVESLCDLKRAHQKEIDALKASVEERTKGTMCFRSVWDCGQHLQRGRYRPPIKRGVIVNTSGYLSLHSTGNGSCEIDATTSTFGPSIVVTSATGVAVPFGGTRGFNVPAGPTTFSLVCRGLTTAVTDASMTAIYIAGS